MPIFLLLIVFYCIPSLAQNKSNPDISLNTLFTYRTSSEGNSPDAEHSNGFSLQEAELRMTSNIDTHFRGDVILALEQNEGALNEGDPEYVVEPEEVFVETLSLPGVTIRAGKFYPYWGRTNQRHTHALAFIDPPQTRQAIFGEEGFNETGLAISYLVPTSWYFELVGQAFSAGNENVFGSPSQDDVAGVLFVKNLWELSDSSTLEWDLGYASGFDVQSNRNHVYNTALTYKCKCSGGLSKVATVEYTQAEKIYDDTGTQLGRTSALSAWLKWQNSKYFWSQVRLENVENREDPSIEDIRKSTALIAYVPSEFSALRLQYDVIDDPNVNPNEEEKRLTLQLNLTMGVHPAHDY